MDRIPSRDLPEVDHGGPASDLHAVRILLDDAIHRIMSLAHYTDAIPSGRQWTIPLEMDCGFDGEFVIRVRDAGSCTRSLVVGAASDVMLAADAARRA